MKIHLLALSHDECEESIGGHLIVLVRYLVPISLSLSLCQQVAIQLFQRIELTLPVLVALPQQPLKPSLFASPESLVMRHNKEQFLSYHELGLIRTAQTA